MAGYYGGNACSKKCARQIIRICDSIIPAGGAGTGREHGDLKMLQQIGLKILCLQHPVPVIVQHGSTAIGLSVSHVMENLRGGKPRSNFTPIRLRGINDFRPREKTRDRGLLCFKTWEIPST